MFSVYARTRTPGAAQTAELDLGGVYLLPEDTVRVFLERPHGPQVAGGDFRAYEATSVADIRTLGDGYGYNYATYSALNGLTVANLEGAVQASAVNATSGVLFGATMGPLARIDAAFGVQGVYNGGSYGFSVEMAGDTTTAARLRTGASPYLALSVGDAVASIGLLPTGALGNTSVPLRMSLQLAAGRQCGLTLQAMHPSYPVFLSNGSAVNTASVGNASGVLTPAQPAITMSRPSGLAQPVLYQVGAYQPQSAASRAAPADIYVLDWMTPRRLGGAAPTDVTAQLGGQARGPVPMLSTPSPGPVAVLCQPLAGPANDVLSTAVRVRDRFSYAR
jgi:hypothetical protein